MPHSEAAHASRLVHVGSTKLFMLSWWPSFLLCTYAIGRYAVNCIIYLKSIVLCVHMFGACARVHKRAPAISFNINITLSALRSMEKCKNV